MNSIEGLAERLQQGSQAGLVDGFVPVGNIEVLTVPVGALYNPLGLFVQFVTDGTVADEKRSTDSIDIPWARGRSPIEFSNSFAYASFLHFYGMA